MFIQSSLKLHMWPNTESPINGGLPLWLLSSAENLKAMQWSSIKLQSYMKQPNESLHSQSGHALSSTVINLAVVKIYSRRVLHLPRLSFLIDCIAKTLTRAFLIWSIWDLWIDCQHRLITKKKLSNLGLKGQQTTLHSWWQITGKSKVIKWFSSELRSLSNNICQTQVKQCGIKMESTFTWQTKWLTHTNLFLQIVGGKKSVQFFGVNKLTKQKKTQSFAN